MNALVTTKTIQSLVIDYVPGMVIDRPCIVRNAPMEWYHGQPCIGPSVSSSNIRKGEDRSLKHAYREWSGNPNKKPDEDKPHFGVGRAIHELAAGNREEFNRLFVVRPSQWDSWRTKDAKTWRAERQLEGITCLTPDEFEGVAGMLAALTEHPTIEAGILQGLVEHSIFWQDAETGIWCKSRPDVIPIDSGMVVDLKSTMDASRAACERTTGDLGYHVQLGMVDEGLRALGFTMDEFVLVFIEKEDPWAINHKPMPFYDIEYGRRQLRRALRKWALAIETGDWPGYEDDEVEGGLPKWRRERLAWEAENGLLPPLLDAPEEEGV